MNKKTFLFLFGLFVILTFSIVAFNTALAQEEIIPNEPHQSFVEPAGEATFWFQGSAGDRVGFEILSFTSGFNASVSLESFDSTGFFVADSFSFGVERTLLQSRLPRDGIYLLRVINQTQVRADFIVSLNLTTIAGRLIPEIPFQVDILPGTGPQLYEFNLDAASPYLVIQNPSQAQGFNFLVVIANALGEEVDRVQGGACLHVYRGSGPFEATFDSVDTNSQGSLRILVTGRSPWLCEGAVQQIPPIPQPLPPTSQPPQVPTVPTTVGVPDGCVISPQNVDVNIRFGPGVAYALAGALLRGQSMEVVGISPNGWYTDGRGRWIASFVVDATGTDCPRLPIRRDYPPPPTPIPPTFTPTYTPVVVTATPSPTYTPTPTRTVVPPVETEDPGPGGGCPPICVVITPPGRFPVVPLPGS